MDFTFGETIKRSGDEVIRNQNEGLSDYLTEIIREALMFRLMTERGLPIDHPIGEFWTLIIKTPGGDISGHEFSVMFDMLAKVDTRPAVRFLVEYLERPNQAETDDLVFMFEEISRHFVFTA